MVVRVMVAVIGLPLFFLIVYFAPPWALPLALAVVCILSVTEILGAVGVTKEKLIMAVAWLWSALIPFWVYFEMNSQMLLPGLFTLILLLFIIWLCKHKTVTFAMIGITFLTLVMVPMFFTSILRIFNMENGKMLILLPFLTAWMADSFAYFTGILFGKHKLAPYISPKKTVEGAVGGVVGSMLSCLLYGWVGGFFFDLMPHYGLLLLFGFVLSLIAELGDLSMSLIKREFGIKDFGTIFPGHGGMMDRFDSVLFTAPLCELMLLFLPAVFGGILL